MPGVAGRSGRPSSTKSTTKRDGKPQSPRALSETGQKHFDWLLERLNTMQDDSPWRRIDGSTLATLAELLESEERLSEALKKEPLNERYLRLRVQYADRVFKFSTIVGMTPRDRERLPQGNGGTDDDADEWSDSK